MSIIHLILRNTFEVLATSLCLVLWEYNASVNLNLHLSKLRIVCICWNMFFTVKMEVNMVDVLSGYCPKTLSCFMTRTVFVVKHKFLFILGRWDMGRVEWVSLPWFHKVWSWSCVSFTRENSVFVIFLTSFFPIFLREKLLFHRFNHVRGFFILHFSEFPNYRIFLFLFFHNASYFAFLRLLSCLEKIR